MRLGWLVRLALLAVLVVPIAIGVDCGVRPGAWGDATLLRFCPANTVGAPALFPSRILPEWHLPPFFAVLKASPSKGLSVALLGVFLLAPLALAFSRWSTAPARAWLSLLAAPVILAGLAWAGAQPPEGAAIRTAQILTLSYVLLFVLVFPVLANTGVARRRSPP